MCEYPNEDEITGANKGAVVAYTGGQVESLVERLYRGNGPDGDERGAEVRSDFMDGACVGEDPHFPSDNKCSSNEELDDDEEVDDLPNAHEARPTAPNASPRSKGLFLDTYEFLHTFSQS